LVGTGTDMLANDSFENEAATSHDEPVREAPGAQTGHVMAPLFSPLELLVIGIGRRDPPALLDPSSRWARLRRWMFGIETPNPFADPRLEALRSLAGALRQRRRSPDARIANAQMADAQIAKAQIAKALAAGITPRQVEYLKAHDQD